MGVIGARKTSERGLGMGVGIRGIRGEKRKRSEKNYK